MVTTLWVSFYEEGIWGPGRWTHPRVTAKESCPCIIPHPGVHGDLWLASNQWKIANVMKCYSIIMLHYVWPCQDPRRKMVPCMTLPYVGHGRELWMACRNWGPQTFSCTELNSNNRNELGRGVSDGNTASQHLVRSCIRVLQRNNQ